MESFEFSKHVNYVNMLTKHVKLTMLGWFLLFTHQIAFLYGNSAAGYYGRFLLQHFFYLIKKWYVHLIQLPTLMLGCCCDKVLLWSLVFYPVHQLSYWRNFLNQNFCLNSNQLLYHCKKKKCLFNKIPHQLCWNLVYHFSELIEIK